MSSGLVRAFDRALDGIAADRPSRRHRHRSRQGLFRWRRPLGVSSKPADDPQRLIDTLAFNQRVLAKIEQLRVPSSARSTALRSPVASSFCCAAMCWWQRRVRGSATVTPSTASCRPAAPRSVCSGSSRQSRQPALLQSGSGSGRGVVRLGPDQRSRAGRTADVARQGNCRAIRPAKPGSAGRDQEARTDQLSVTAQRRAIARRSKPTTIMSVARTSPKAWRRFATSASPAINNDGWAVRRARHTTLETIAPRSDYAVTNPPALAD